ncbi:MULTISPECIES: hypothetical protein [Paraburkholderia]|uniref:hypothetical protein n=1 Tax=Paraburkholderia TaxID=1822464 RepID=UPI0003806604|nr:MULTISPECIES: hypothetical protein [Paraburkholderia]MDH6147584.1 hypothetical protein [Paraburkholderia sp. WSM4179]
MLNWDDEITAVTPSEARAYRKIGGRARAGDSTAHAVVNKVVILVGNLSRTCLSRYVHDVLEFEYFEPGDADWQTAWSRNASILRAAILRRWLGEIRGRALAALRSAMLFAKPQTGSEKAIAKRISLLGAPPQFA